MKLAPASRERRGEPRSKPGPLNRMVSGQAVLVWKGKLRQQKGKQLELRLAIARMKVSLFSTSCHTLAEIGLSSLSPEISLGLQQVLRMALAPPDTGVLL